MKIFSPTLKREIRDCILAIFWPKKEIFKFFKDCSVPANILKKVEAQQVDLSRFLVVDCVFDELAEQPDNGTIHFNIMLDSLSVWTHFDSYWFDNQQKLNLVDAKKRILNLSQAKMKDVDVARKRAAEQKVKADALEEKYNSLKEMKEDFLNVCTESKTSQARGYAFEKFLGKMARFYGLKVTDSFRIKGTQIDGTIKYDGENYNIEAKWHDRALSDEPLLSFCRKQEINMYGRGIFISINGYTEGALRMLEKGSMKNAILMDGEDIALIMNEMVTLPDAIDRKIQAAQTRGEFYINPVSEKNKIP
jgi:hypothetical protein